MRELTPTQVLSVLYRRLTKRSEALKRLQMPAYDTAARELEQFAAMAKRARDYVEVVSRRRN